MAAQHWRQPTPCHWLSIPSPFLSYSTQQRGCILTVSFAASQNQSSPEVLDYEALLIARLRDA